MHSKSSGEGMAIYLRPTRREDLERLFEIQLDPLANDMAGTKARTREALFSAWEGHFANPAINGCVVEVGGEIVGSIACFQSEGRDCVGYWIAREWWGKGVASRTLEMFLEREARRPLHATTAATNAASRRILEKCGFRVVGVKMGEETERFVAREVVEWVLE